MPEPLKNLINPATVENMTQAFLRAAPDFPADAFRSAILPTLSDCELMQRALLISDAMEACLPQDFLEAAPIMRSCLPQNERQGLSGWALLPFNHYISRRGHEHFDVSLDLLKVLTPHFTAEFGIRTFIHADQDRALQIIGGWISDPNHHIRRLASEGTRPRLPWAMRLPKLVLDPAPILPILTALLDDPEDYVRRSVANSLNDIAKDHPDVVADFVERHAPGASKDRAWLLKHASRTLIKQGHGKALANFGFEPLPDVSATLALAQDRVAFPDQLDFTVELANQGASARTVMLDYAIHHRKKDGSASPKVFKGRTFSLAAGETAALSLRHAFRPITTRVYYSGAHRLEVMLNGTTAAGADFVLDMTASGA